MGNGEKSGSSPARVFSTILAQLRSVFIRLRCRCSSCGVAVVISVRLFIRCRCSVLSHHFACRLGRERCVSSYVTCHGRCAVGGVAYSRCTFFADSDWWHTFRCHSRRLAISIPSLRLVVRLLFFFFLLFNWVHVFFFNLKWFAFQLPASVDAFVCFHSF